MHRAHCQYQQHHSTPYALSIWLFPVKSVSTTSASSSPNRQPRQASRVEYEHDNCATCADVLVCRERTTTLSYGHRYNLFCFEDLARHLRYRPFGQRYIAINRPGYRRSVSMRSISSFEHVRLVSLPRVYLECHCLVYISPSTYGVTQINRYGTVRLLGQALVEDMEGRRLPGCITPPGWGPCLLEYRRRVCMEPVLPGVPSAREHDVVCLYSAQSAAIMEWDSALAGMFPGDTAPIIPVSYTHLTLPTKA